MRVLIEKPGHMEALMLLPRNDRSTNDKPK